QARFAPDTSIVFPNKESLYRKSKEEARVIRITWIRIAAAAVVLLFAGAMGWNFFFSGEKGNGGQSGTKTSGQVAVTEPKDSSTKNSTEPKSTTDPETTAPQIAKTTEKTQSKEESAVKNSAKEKIRRNLAKDEERNSPLVGVEKKFVEEKSNLFDEKNVPNIENATNSKVDKVAGLNVPEVKVVDQQVDFASASEKMSKNDVVQTGLTMKTEDELEVLNTSVKKNTSRGLFRKVTRVIGSVTNLGPKDKETSNSKGLRIANVEIALK